MKTRLLSLKGFALRIISIRESLEHLHPILEIYRLLLFIAKDQFESSETRQFLMIKRIVMIIDFEVDLMIKDMIQVRVK
jgi:hypothetical protein